MKVAFSVWNNRIAPVFDTARDFLIVEVTDGNVVSKEDLHIEKSSLFDKIDTLKKHNIQRMVCGAISVMARCMVESEDLILTAFVSGDIDDVVLGCLNGELESEVFAMPGCCGCLRRGAGFGRQFRAGAGGGGRHGHGGPQFKGV